MSLVSSESISFYQYYPEIHFLSVLADGPLVHHIFIGKPQKPPPPPGVIAMKKIILDSVTT